MLLGAAAPRHLQRRRGLSVCGGAGSPPGGGFSSAVPSQAASADSSGDGSRWGRTSPSKFATATAGCRRRRLYATTKFELPLRRNSTGSLQYLLVVLKQQHLQVSLSMAPSLAGSSTWMILLVVSLKGIGLSCGSCPSFSSLAV